MAKADVPEPPGTGVPFSSSTPVDVSVHLFPELSVRLPPEVGVSSLELGVGVGAGVGAGVGVAVRMGAAELVQDWLVGE